MSQPAAAAAPAPRPTTLFEGVVRLIPARLWWALAGGLFAALNLLFAPEIWPHTPNAEKIFWPLALLCGWGGMWAGVQTIGRISQHIAGFFWRAVWSVLWVGSTVIAVLLTGLLFLVLFFSMR